MARWLARSGAGEHGIQARAGYLNKKVALLAALARLDV
jgi:hypothetical protein